MRVHRSQREVRSETYRRAKLIDLRCGDPPMSAQDLRPVPNTKEFVMPGTPIRVESSEIAEGDDLELDSWLAADGSEVESEQLVAEVSTAKAIVEVTAPVGGALRQSLTVGAVFGPEEAIGFVDHE